MPNCSAIERELLKQGAEDVNIVRGGLTDTGPSRLTSGCVIDFKVGAVEVVTDAESSVEIVGEVVKDSDVAILSGIKRKVVKKARQEKCEVRAVHEHGRAEHLHISGCNWQGFARVVGVATKLSEARIRRLKPTLEEQFDEFA